jgi:ABC-2 type transport system permease protein
MAAAPTEPSAEELAPRARPTIARRENGCGVRFLPPWTTSRGGGTVSDDTYIAPPVTFRQRLSYNARIVRVLSRSEFKLKYAGSILGYFWSLGKPLMYFTVLWIVFGGLFDSGIERYPQYLLIGIVLNTFLVDAVTATLPSIVWSGPTIRRISFPPLVIPLATSLAAAMTFAANCVVIGAFLAIAGLRPEMDWLLLVPLLLELYVFVLALALLAATLYVRFRDVGQIWEVASSLLFFSAPIMYPITILPEWAQRLDGFNPFVQVMQDVRAVLLGADAGVTTRFDSRLFPIMIAVGLLVIALLLHRRESPRFAERA